VTIGGVNAPVGFSGLAPGFAGLYQVNAQVPPNAPTGDAVPIVISVGTAQSPGGVTIAVQ
jgi:trimeric autotransporter adhesin